MFSFTLRETARITDGTYFGPESLLDAHLRDITIDSRRADAGCLFVPIAGEKFDGHDFIMSAFENGAAACLTEKEPIEGCPMIKVESTVAAFRALAGAYRMKTDIPVIGVVGSVGKTTTKELIAAVLQQKFNPLKNHGDLNNQTGVPLTLFRLTDDHTAAVIEMGSNHFGEIASLAEIVRPDIAVITNIGEAHLEYFGTRDGILREGSDVFKYMDDKGVRIVNGDDDKLCTLRGKMPGLVFYGIDPSNDIYAEDIVDMGFEGVSFTAVWGDNTLPVTVPSPGKYMVLRALCAIAVGIALNMEPADIAKGIAEYVPAAGRMNIIKTGRITILSDAYNASPSSVKSSIDIACKGEGRKVLILGDMYELGSYELEYHRQVGEYAANSGGDLLLSVGRLSAAMHEAAQANGLNALHFDTKEQLLNSIDSIINDGDTILIKASHSVGLEKAADYLAANY